MFLSKKPLYTALIISLFKFRPNLWFLARLTPIKVLNRGIPVQLTLITVVWQIMMNGRSPRRKPNVVVRLTLKVRLLILRLFVLTVGRSRPRRSVFRWFGSSPVTRPIREITAWPLLKVSRLIILPSP